MVRQRTSRSPAPVHRRSRGLRRILVALDGSSEGETVLGHLPTILGARCDVILIHVIPTPPPSSSPQMLDVLRLEEEAEHYLEKVGERFRRLKSRWIVETGDPAERILAAARDEGVDALALTTHARSRMTSLLMGSVARQVVQRSGRPVFLVRPGVPPLRRTHRHLLVPLDGPEGAETVLRVVEPLAKPADSKVTLLHILPAPRVADPVTGFNPIILKPIQLPEVAWLDPLVDLLFHHGIRAAKSVLVGEPEELILRECRTLNPDLLVLRTRGRGGLARLILGSV